MEKNSKSTNSQLLDKTEQEEVTISKGLLRKIHTFIATTNNYLMTQSVQGDAILSSAKLMTEAGKLCKEIDDRDK